MLLTTDKAKKEKQGMQPKMLAILVTVGIHLLLGAFAAIRSILPEPDYKPEITAQILGPPEEARQQVQKRTVKKQIDQVVAMAPPMSRVLRTEALAMTAVPEMTSLVDTPIGLGEGNLGVGFGAARSRNMGKGAMFFGQQVAGNMGVVFDVSSSMHSYVPIVVDEIMRVFRNAMVVCVNSASFVPEADVLEVVPYEDANSSVASVPYFGSEEARQMHKDLLTLPNCWYVKREINSLGGGIEYLMQEGTETIFVFSDFQDVVVPDYLGQLGLKAKDGGHKINLHVLDKARAYGNELQKLATSTGGKYAEGELLRRAKR